MTQTEKKVALKPLGNRVLAQRVEAEEKQGGIILPESAQKKPETAVVIAVGSGKQTDEGKTIPVTVKVGDKIIMDKYSGQEVTINDEEYLIVKSDDIIAIVE